MFWETKRSRLEEKQCRGGQGDEWGSLHGFILLLREWEKGQILSSGELESRSLRCTCMVRNWHAGTTIRLYSWVSMRTAGASPVLDQAISPSWHLPFPSTWCYVYIIPMLYGCYWQFYNFSSVTHFGELLFRGWSLLGLLQIRLW